MTEAKVTWTIDIPGKVSNTILPVTKPLLPLFEGIANSLDAIEERQISNGTININLFRDSSQTFEEDLDSLQPIIAFEIIDNGIGFNEKNYESFHKSDTRFKSHKGAKGVGRFLWLKAFDNVCIDSTFKDNGSAYQRTFNFICTHEGSTYDEIKGLENYTENTTSIYLNGFKEKYQLSSPHDEIVIAHKIIQHCLVHFITDKCPIITIHDRGKTIVLNDVYKNEYSRLSEKETIVINDISFDLLFYKLFARYAENHRIHYCACNREVKSEKLRRYIPDLTTKLCDDDNDKNFFFSIYISSKYFDETVNLERTDFNISNDESLLPDQISWKEITSSIAKLVKIKFQSYIQPIQEAKLTKIETYIKNHAKRFYPLLKYGSQQIGSIPPNISDESLYHELSKIDFEINQDLNKRYHEMVDNPVNDSDEYKEKVYEFINEFNEIGNYKLAEYVAHRKVIIDLFEKSLKIKDDGKYLFCLSRKWNFSRFELG